MKTLAIFLTAAMALAAAPARDEAQQSGEAWLTLIDNGMYAESWKDASAYFRSRVPEKQWVEMVKGVRAPLGKLVSRKQQGITFTKSLPGAPDGDYAVIVFQTSYANKASAVETLTLMADGNKWRAAGYFIR